MNFIQEADWQMTNIKVKRKHKSRIIHGGNRISKFEFSRESLNFEDVEYPSTEQDSKSSQRFQLRPDIFKKLIPSLLLISVVTMILMTIYESIKQYIIPNLSLWESHFVTIVFSSIAAPLGAYLALRKIEILRQEGIQEIETRKKIEEKLQRTQESLEFKIKSRTEDLLKANAMLNLEIKDKQKAEAELIKAKEKAEKSDQLKSEFLAQISHEIRTPINAILSFSSLIREEIEHKIEDDLKSGFSVINSAGKRIIRTVDLVLNMSELQTGTFEYLPRKINLCEEVLSKVYTEYYAHASSKKLKLTMTKKMENPVVFADEHTVHQIFGHLVDNAIKFTRKGEVEIIIDSDEYKNVIVHVRDTGIGISKEYMKEIYKPFLQENNGYTREYEGNGLGLALVKNYCDLNKAKILLESEKGKGSTFSVVFTR